MNKKVFIRQDGSIPGHRIIEELGRRGGWDERDVNTTIKGASYLIMENDAIDYMPIDYVKCNNYTELIYNKETDSFYEKSQRMVSAEAKESLFGNGGSLMDLPFGAYDSKLEGYEWTIPEGYEAIIEDGKIIVRKKRWRPKVGDTVWHCHLDEYYPTSDTWDRDYQLGINDFQTKEECQAFCDKLNNAVKQILKERRKEVEK